MPGLYRPNAMNQAHKIMSETQTSSELAPYDSHNIGYGIITDVDEETSQVKVKKLVKEGIYEESEILDGAFLPIINSLEDVFNRFGSLRKGLLVRLHWLGRLNPKHPFVEVIAGENSSLLKKDPQVNEISHGPYKMFQGGVT